MATNQRHVDPQNGNDTNDGLLPTTAWLSLGKSITDAPSDCDIFCAPGQYNLAATVEFNDGGAARIDRHWIADQGDAQIVGTITSNALIRIHQNAAPSSVEGFEIISTTAGQTAAVELRGGNSIIDCLCFNSGRAGIYCGEGGTATAFVTRCVAIGEEAGAIDQTISGAALRIRTAGNFPITVDRTTLLHMSASGA